MKHIPFILLLLACGICTVVKAQVNPAVALKGTVKDTLAGKALPYASIAILNQKDSVLVKGTRADEQGNFKFNQLRPGAFILTVSQTGYQDRSIPFSINSSSQAVIDFGIVPLREESLTLNEVVIKGKKLRAISMNGDTIEFLADSFKVAPNARVEDLLKQMPNVRIDGNGKITYGNQSIKKVLVDGEEFFSSDPTLVTRNVRADMVEKVQVYDAAESGSTLTKKMDGDAKEKTLNLTLKEDKKNGYFGKIEGGAGNGGYYQGQLMLNAFRNKEKLAMYGIFSNNGLVGLSWQDEENFAGGEGWNGSFDGKGIPEVQTGGLHYSNRWNANKHGININAKIANLDVSGENNSLVQTNLPQLSNFTRYDQQFNNHSLRHKGEVSYEYHPSTSATLAAVVDLSLDRIDTEQTVAQQISTPAYDLLNWSNRNLAHQQRQKNLSSRLNWNQELKKKGRSFSLEAIQGYKTGTENDRLSSLSTFFNNNDPSTSIDSTVKVDQSKQNRYSLVHVQSKLLYAEPLSRSTSLLFELSSALRHSQANVQTFNQAQDRSYSELEPRLSSHYRFDETAHNASATYRYKKGKLSVNTTAEINLLRLSQTNRIDQSSLFRKYTFLRPQFRAKYAFTSQRSITLQYALDNIIPELAQLQPITLNEDPFNLYTGNPLLDPSIRHTVKLLAKDYIPEKEETLLLNGSIALIQDPIVPTFTSSAAGVNNYSYLNVKNRNTTNANINLLYGRKLDLWDLRLTANALFLLNKQLNFSNGQMNKSSNNAYSNALGLNKLKPNVYDLSVYGSINYTDFKNSLDKSFNQAFFTFTIIPAVNYSINKSFRLYTGATFRFQQKSSAMYTSFNQVLWNAALTKNLASDRISLKLSANDLLNQNQGFNRSTIENRFTQNTYTTIARNFMLTLIYDINKLGLLPSPK
ncbi:TonB-dependent receptor [Pedobacter sp. Du54]|uniref:TonB-dependent receptor n=1 Tax=Pedobacter anseongensis TaxID=3133439 RepID=UPI0030A7EB4D